MVAIKYYIHSMEIHHFDGPTELSPSAGDLPWEFCHLAADVATQPAICKRGDKLIQVQFLFNNPAVISAVKQG